MSDGRVIIDIDGDDAGFRKDIDGLAGQVDRGLKGVQGSLSKAGGWFTKYITAPFLAATGAVIAFGVKTAGSFEQTAISFETMLGSAEAGQKMFDDLKAFAAQTPFELPGLLDASKKLLAFGFAAEDIIPTLTSVGDAAAGLGLGTEGLERIVTALGQMKAKGKVSAEEMLQLAESGIPAWEALATKIGVSIPEAMKLAEKGAIDAQTGIAAITEMMDTKFGDMMLKQSKTLQGLWSTFKDVFSIRLGEALQKNLDPMKDALIELTAALGPLVDALVPSLIAVIEQLLPVASSLLTGIMDAFVDAGPETQKAILMMVAAVSLLGGPLLKVAARFDDIRGAIRLLTSAKLAATLGNWSAAFSLVGSNLTAPIGQLTALGTQATVTSAAFVALAGAAGYAAGSLINQIPAVRRTADALADAAAEADSFGEYLKVSGERQKTWVDYALPWVSTVQQMAGSLGFLAGQVGEVSELTEDYGLVLDETGAPTAESIEALKRRNAAMRTEAAGTAEATDAAYAYRDALLAIEDAQNSSERADIALERAKLRLTDAQKAYDDILKEYPASSREAQGAALDLRDAQLDVEDASKRAAAATSDVIEANAKIRPPDGANLKAWLDYYQKIGDKAGYAAAKANLATAALTGGKVKSGGGTLQIPLGATGAVMEGPASGYLAMLHGKEAVIPFGDQAALDKYLPMLLASLPNLRGRAVAPHYVPQVAETVSSDVQSGGDIVISGKLPMSYVESIFALRDWTAGLVT